MERGTRDVAYSPTEKKERMKRFTQFRREREKRREKRMTRGRETVNILFTEEGD